ncbi:hypothetical protein GobsT_51150 [Gemmata obscuriglobus]|uniref:Class I SAM-dependent methyltransferase n=1 Tax=Gemmata obscuriglobus TaxID=114 RepID=A0A2Z3GZS4_9BACT|nr:class I SAM-dependent methyltransferase [Gemmata obscuriglobus]AWM36997.1 class I SAM-dependent methyltransferase [Gemmata obscuriglobus]QEG30310.1 hypothetical protein GobsT_51150 [Gemmata obscuriglobus]VTS09634.1 helicase : Uncharacterized protein OS=Blastopirellula marina DSM 3645 GN=DSM3645_28042 PE=4 SV=1 [Gemmata obscuriglobus UQM 2246]
MPPKPTKKPGPSLFDYLDEEPPATFADRVGEKPPASTFAERVRPPAAPVTPPVDPVPEAVRGPPLSNGEKGKARDIIAAIKTLHQVEKRGTPATPEERDTLAKYPGMGPVALSIFPNPANGQYKDDSWKALGEELKALLTHEEYASARRTTFNAFYTSPTVVDAMHSALTRLGVPDDALVLEPGCGPGTFLRPGKRYIGVELDSSSFKLGDL